MTALPFGQVKEQIRTTLFIEKYNRWLAQRLPSIQIHQDVAQSIDLSAILARHANNPLEFQNKIMAAAISPGAGETPRLLP